MRSPLSGPIATLLMLVPLCAVPVLAVIGVPQVQPGAQNDEQLVLADVAPSTEPNNAFAPIADLSQNPNPSAEPAPAAAPNPAAPPAVAATPTPNPAPATPNSAPAETPVASHPNAPAEAPVKNGFAPSAGPGWRLNPEALAAIADPAPAGTSSASPAETTGDAAPPADPNDEWAAETPAEPPAHDAFADQPPATEQVSLADRDPLDTSPSAGQRAAASPASGGASGTLPQDSSADGDQPAPTLEAALNRLRKLGISDFRLQPGSRSDEYHFSCNLIANGNPRITHHFEAEAGEPLVAVEKVLQQVEAKFPQP